MDPLLTTVVRPGDPPLISVQADGTWHLDLPDAETTIVLSAAQVRRLVDDYLEQQLGGSED